MRTTRTFCAVAVFAALICLLFNIAAFGQEQIPGGVAFLENGKVVFYNFATAQKTGPITIKEPFAVSEDGRALMWIENGKAWARRFSSSRVSLAVEMWKLSPPFLVASSNAIQEKNVRNLVLSSGGKLFAHELQAIGLNYFQTSAPRLNPKYYPEPKQMNGKNTPLRNGGTDGLPIYDAKTDSFNGINCFFAGITDKSRGSGEAFSKFGNAVCYKPAYYIAGGGIRDSLLQHSNVLPADSTSQISCTAGDNEYSQEYYKTKHHAFFPAWESASSVKPNIPDEAGQGPGRANPGDMFFAFFCQSVPSGQDSIKVRETAQLHYTKMFSIPLHNGSSASGGEDRKCEGLAWKPNMSLTYWANGKLFEINGSSLMAKIRKVWEEDAAEIMEISRNKKGTVKTAKGEPEGIILQEEPAVIAEGISATRGAWVSDDTFVFRDKDGTLNSWSKTGTKKLLSSIPETFFYCSFWPAQPAQKPIIRAVAAQAAISSP